MTPKSDRSTTELIICTTCRPAENTRDQRAAGDILLEAVQTAQAFGDQPEWAAIHVRGVVCTAGCSRACTVAFQAPGKHSFQFGDLTPRGRCPATAGLRRDAFSGARWQLAPRCPPWPFAQRHPVPPATDPFIR